MVISGTLLKISAGVVAVLVIALCIAGWLLKGAWQDNATLEANNAQLHTTIKSQVKAFHALEKEKARDENIVTDNAEDKQTIVEYRDRVKYEIKTIIKKVPADDCLKQSMPPALLECLQSDRCGEGAGDQAGLPTAHFNAGDTRAHAAG